MIKNRPEKHLKVPHYTGLPAPPYRVEIEKIPDLIKLMVLTLRHVEPLGADALTTIDPIVEDYPHEDERAFYERIDPDFQLVFLVVNSIFGKDEGEYRSLYPYSLSLVPSTKRSKVEEMKFSSVKAFAHGIFDEEWAYMSLDPFSGEWGFFSQLSLIADMGKKRAFTDELGIVHDYYFLRKDVELAEIAQPAIGIEGQRMKRFMRNRAKLLYKPFNGVSARRLWGVENGLELFVLQEIVRQNLPWPTIQAQIYDDPAVYPSLYHAWSERETMDDKHFIAEADFCFENEKIAVFCDGAHHNRKRVRIRDAAINERLASLGFDVIRISSSEIQRDVEDALGPLTERFRQ